MSISDAKTNADSKPCLMVIGAHHDDNELIAGTLAIHRDAGWSIISVVVTDGRWVAGKVSDANIEIRESESIAAAKMLGTTCEFLRFPEGRVPTDDTAFLKIIDVIRKHRPSVVITHPTRDYHTDHMQVNKLVERAVLQSWNSTVETEHSPIDSPPSLYYSDAWFTPFEPDEYVDVTEQIDLKQEVLRCHQSQLPQQDETATSMIDLELVRSRNRGIEAGVQYAEAFRRAPKPFPVRKVNLLK